MKEVAACSRFQGAYDKSKEARKATKFFSKERKAAKKKESEAKRALKTCVKTNTGKGGIRYAKGLARAASDAKVKFGLKQDFHKHAGLFKTDNIVRDAFKVKTDDEVMPAARKFAKKNDLDEAAQHAAAVYVLKDALVGTQAGFITAQVALAVLDVLAGIVTLGGYEAAAPFVHAGVGAGQTVSVAAIKADMNKHEQMYQNALAKRKTKIDAAAALKAQQEQEKAAAELKTAAEGRLTTAKQASDAEKPWYTRTEVVGAGILLGAAGLAFALSRRGE